MARFPLLVTLIASCGDNDVMTWRDAVSVWSESWCSYVKDCAPVTYEANGGKDCERVVTELNCMDAPWDCSQPYSHSWSDLHACREAMYRLECGAIFAPEACYRAFEY